LRGTVEAALTKCNDEVEAGVIGSHFSKGFK